MADKKESQITFRKVENGFIIKRNTEIFNEKGEWKSSEKKEFVSTTAAGTKKMINEMTESMKDEIKETGTTNQAADEG